MRILFVTTSLVQGGAERHAITLMNRLSERGHDCHAAYVKSDASQRDKIQISGDVQCLEAQRFLDIGAARRMAEVIDRVRPNAILAANPFALLYAHLGRSLAQWSSPVAVSYHSTRVLGAKEQIKHQLDRRLIRHADALIFVSEMQARYWRQRHLTARRVSVIPNGIDHIHFNPETDAATGHALRSALGIAPSAFLIGMVAMLRPEKNPLQLVEAVSALRQKGLPAHALLVGDGPLRGAVEAAAAARGVAGQIHIAGLRDDVRPYIAACDATVLCSLTEALSLAALEAMAMGKPVVHPEVGGGPEMILPGFNGDLYPVGDTAALTACLAALANPVQAARLGCNARRVVMQKFTEEAMVTQYENLLTRLSPLPAAFPHISGETTHVY